MIPWLLALACLMAEEPLAQAETEAIAGNSQWVLNVDNEPIDKVIKKVAKLEGYRCIIDGELQGEISGQFRSWSLTDFLNKISVLYHLVWFIDGKSLVVSPDAMVETRVFGSDRFEVRRLHTALQKLGLLNASIHTRLLKEENILIIAAPPAFLEVVESIGDALDSAESIPLSEQETVRIFSLDYAWAYDLTFNYSGSSISVPGVATLLSEVMTGQKQAGGNPSNNQANAPVALQPVAGEMVTAEDFGRTPPENEDETMLVFTKNTNPNVSITADVRRNAVIVRDRKSRMSLYEGLIEEFDQPAKIISISAVIVDLSSQAKLNLGLEEFTAQKGNTEFSLTPASLANTASNFNAMAKVVTGGWELMSKIRAQEIDGNARIVSQPAVLTFNNMGAVISRDASFYIPVAGTFNSQLYEVTTGLNLRVTPQILHEEGRTKIKLLITVKDGTIQQQENDVQGIPRTTENFINTQAIIDEGQSLLIGGLYTNTRRIEDSGIPFLKDIPILGYAFKTETTENSQTERVYLITPEIISVDVSRDQVEPFLELLGTPAPNDTLSSPTLYRQEENFLTPAPPVSPKPSSSVEQTEKPVLIPTPPPSINTEAPPPPSKPKGPRRRH